MTTVRSGLGPSEIILKRKYADVQNLLSSIIRRVVFGRGKWCAGVDGFGGLFFTLGRGLENGVAGADTALEREPRWDRRGRRGGQVGALRGQEVPKVFLGGLRERVM